MAVLKNKVAIITGAAGGIGLATSRLFVQEGANVLLVDRDETALKTTVSQIGLSQASSTVADVTQPQDVQNYVQTAVKRYGRVDIFINNAGIEGVVKKIADYPIETFDQVMAINVRGVWLGLKYVIPEMEKHGGGSIVVTSSIMGIKGAPSNAAYSASKHAVVGLVRSAANECASMNIRVNAINPGLIMTRMTDSLAQQIRPDNPEQAKQDIAQTIPMQRYGTPEEVAQMMLFLASDASSYCTGGIFTTDGGITQQ